MFNAYHETVWILIDINKITSLYIFIKLKIYQFADKMLSCLAKGIKLSAVFNVTYKKNQQTKI